MFLIQNGNILAKQESTISIGHPDITTENIKNLTVTSWTKDVGNQVDDLSIWNKILTVAEMVDWTTCR